MPKVSVIIPVYGAERWIERCARSLFEQTLDSIEYIFVDDCSPDASIAVLQRVLADYPNRQPQVQILRNEQNIGVGQSRQRAIDLACGDYLIHCDPDDYVDLNYYQTLLQTAIDTDADVVICDFIRESEADASAVVQHQNIPTYPTEVIKNMCDGSLYMSLWNKLVRADLAKRFRIQPGINMWEDVSITIPILASARLISTPTQQQAYYHYRVGRKDSITALQFRITSAGAESRIRAIESVTNILLELGIDKQIDPKILSWLQWKSKLPYFRDPSAANLKRWKEAFPNSKNIPSSTKDAILTAIYERLYRLHLYRLANYWQIIRFKFLD